MVFFGTPEFAVPSLRRIASSRYPLVGVVTRPDRPRGRGRRVTDAPVKRAALALGVPVLQPDRLRDPSFRASFVVLGADIAVVAAYGKILPEDLLAVPPQGFVNVHASLLPKYRGAAPIHAAIAAGDTETGVTIMRVVRELDAGPMLATYRYAIGPDETSEDVERALAVLGADLLLDVLERLDAGAVREIPQNAEEATYAPRLTREDGRIDWSRPAIDIHNQVRALHPWPHAFTYVAGARLVILRTALAPGERGAPAGTVVAAAGDTLRIAAGNGRAVDLLLVQPEGRRPMGARDFLTGHRLAAGARLTSSPPPTGNG